MPGEWAEQVASGGTATGTVCDCTLQSVRTRMPSDSGCLEGGTVPVLCISISGLPYQSLAVAVSSES